ncbi:unnamed protein product [Ectocarpus sp. 12 AP-2014]
MSTPQARQGSSYASNGYGSTTMSAPLPDHPLMVKERTGSSVRPLQLAYMIYGGREAFERMKEIQAEMEAEPVFERDDRPFLDHTKRYLRSAEKMARFHNKCREMGLTDPQEIAWAYVAIDEVLPTDVHMAMVVPALQYQTSPEQREAWLPLATSFRILGAYVQTELGHGSNVRALETTATFDRATQEFVLHSPTLTSTKWWPGGLGKTSTHCVLMAQLVLDGRVLGVHPFFVQLRSMTDHSPLKGVAIGDIGPKLGFNSTDNGFCRFHHVRVPRTSLLGGVAVVSPEGKYSRVPGGQKQSYGSMLAVRANIVINASRSLARALTIAFRFGAVRTQGYDEREGASPGSERQVLDYPTQQRVLLPLLAHAYALHFAGQHMKSAYHYYLDTQDAEALPDLHATSAGLKALVTQSVADGIEAARKMCGGHGYSQFSGLPDLSSGYLALATLEGTQQVLEPQTARHLLRSLAAARKGKRLSEAFSYLSPSSPQQGAVSVRIGAQLRRPETQLRLFRGRARAAVLAAEEAVQRGGQETTGAGGGAAAGREAMVGAAVELGRATRAHCQLHLVERCTAGVEQQREVAAAAAAARGEELNTREVNVLSSLRDLFALSIVEENMGDFLESGLLEPAAAPLVRREVQSLCLELRPEAISLTDAWQFTDKYLSSALGRSDGRVYPALMEATMAEPLNATDVAPSITSIRELIGVRPNPRL